MKEIRPFKIGDQIPSDAVFLCAGPLSQFSKDDLKGLFFYEVKIKESSTQSAETKAKMVNLSQTITKIVEYLNLLTGKRFLATTDDTRKLIRARLNEGHTPDDFYCVIKKKSSEWLDDPKMNTYLRPSTLFGSKFESYLNAITPTEMSQMAFDELDKIMESE